jgi:uncharacterized protein YcfL
MKIAPLLLALLVLTGCASPAPRPGESARTGANQPDKRMTVDPALHGILRIATVRDLSSSHGCLGFQVNVQNLTSSAQTIIYEVDWLDKDGVSLGVSMEEPPCTLFPKETHPITITSPVPVARDFRLTFRPRRR